MLDEAMLLAFRDELRKEAGFALKNIGSLGGRGALLGAGGGAILGGIHGYQHAEENGQSGVSGALGGAVQGATMGGMAGGLAGGAAGGLVKRDLSHLTQTPGALGAASRFGQRQVHGITGMLSPAEIEGVRGGAHDARQALQTAKAEGSKSVPRLEKALKASEKAQNMGLTSIPGYLKSMKNNGIGKTLRTSAEEQIRNQPVLTAAAVGLPLAAGALAPTEEGQGRGEAVGRAVGGAVGEIAGGMMPMGGQAALGVGSSQVGAWAGRGVDRLRGRRLHNAPTPTMEPTEAQQTATERVMSPAAAGQAPESPV
jgi:hypothetical protein